MSARMAMAATGLALGLALSTFAEPPGEYLEGRRIRAGAVYVGTVTEVRRLGALDGLSAETQGRMEASVRLAKVLRAPAGVTPGAEAAVRFDSRAPEPEGDGFYTLVPGEAVLVFADGLEPAYPRQVLHGAPAALADQVRALRDFLAGMNADTQRLHGVTAATRPPQLRMYDEALTAIAKLPPR